MSKKKEIIRNQRDWAERADLKPDAKSYLASYELNLFQPMSPLTKKSFDQGSGSELRDKPGYPAKMRAVHSSSALVVNIFDPWVSNDLSPLLNILGVDAVSGAELLFEKQYPTGLPGNPPNIDVVMEVPGSQLIGIESKFTEWLTVKSASKSPYKGKYFPEGHGVWARVGLFKTQALAEAIRKRAIIFRHLDVPQLTKHALGLATHLGKDFRLFYIFYDCDGPESERHWREIKQFSDAVGSELGFKVISYQDLFAKLSEAGAGTTEYRSYLRERYFTNAA